MIASTNRSDFISVGTACSEFGMSAPTLRRLLDRNPSLYYRSLGNHRRISRSKLSQFLGLVSPNESRCPLALVCRVSGSNQARKSAPGAECSSLDHQIKRVEDFAREKFGEEAVENASRYYRVGGGLNHEHPILVTLISDILHGKFKGGYIVCQDSIRLMRFGNAIFEQICSFGGCEILYVMEVDRSEAETDLSESVLSILCHFTAKASGARAKKILEICIDEEDLVSIYRHYVSSGCSYSDLAKWCHSRNIAGTKGQTLTSSKLHQILTKNIDMLRRIVPEVTNDTSRFITSHMEPDRYTPMKQTDIYESYVTWCKAENVVPVSAKKLGLALKDEGYRACRKYEGRKCWYAKMV